MWFILTSDHHKMLKQEQKGSKMSEMAIFVGFCLLTRKLIFFLQVLRLFLESTSPIRPLKVNFEVFPTNIIRSRGNSDYKSKYLPQIHFSTLCQLEIPLVDLF